MVQLVQVEFVVGLEVSDALSGALTVIIDAHFYVVEVTLADVDDVSRLGHQCLVRLQLFEAAEVIEPLLQVLQRVPNEYIALVDSCQKHLALLVEILQGLGRCHRSLLISEADQVQRVNIYRMVSKIDSEHSNHKDYLCVRVKAVRTTGVRIRLIKHAQIIGVVEELLKERIEAELLQLARHALT